ncbi:hypothetical protein F2Q70_00017387 [Brassica cretica]|uniref:Uncharacterized protein n=1 Tax=Brassica cretica TaxID=69181 RepID=A0A3N6QT26_BRACR|nr:hypothetical protein F2Q70_00017387 [Brassica cretica]KAF2597441.1 hypothetical protein F2Q68_00010356 [Brassica cretica]
MAASPFGQPLLGQPATGLALKGEGTHNPGTGGFTSPLPTQYALTSSGSIEPAGNGTVNLTVLPSWELTVGVKIGCDEINVRKLPENEKEDENNGKNYQRSNGQLVETHELDRPRDSARPFVELDQSSSANGRAGSTAGFSSAVRRARPVKFGERPRLIDNEIQLGRSPSWISPVQRTAELDRPESIVTSSS